MQPTTLLSIAGLRFRAYARNAEAAVLVARYGAYHVWAGGGEEVPIVLGASEPHDLASFRVDRAGSWMTYSPGDGQLRIGGRARSGDLERLWMHGIAHLLASRAGLVVHAAAVMAPGGAIAFVGPSGAGKTTAALNCDAPLVNPDRVAVGLWGEGAWLAPLPFLHPERADAGVQPRPLARLLLPTKSRNIRVVPSPAREAFREVLAASLLPAAPPAARQVMATVAKLVDIVAVDRLFLRADATFWPLVRTSASVASHTRTR